MDEAEAVIGGGGDDAVVFCATDSVVVPTLGLSEVWDGIDVSCDEDKTEGEGKGEVDGVGAVLGGMMLEGGTELEVTARDEGVIDELEGAVASVEEWTSVEVRALLVNAAEAVVETESDPDPPSVPPDDTAEVVKTDEDGATETSVVAVALGSELGGDDDIELDKRCEPTPTPTLLEGAGEEEEEDRGVVELRPSPAPSPPVDLGPGGVEDPD